MLTLLDSEFNLYKVKFVICRSNNDKYNFASREMNYRLCPAVIRLILKPLDLK